MTRSISGLCIAAIVSLLFPGCGNEGDVQVERLPDVRPNLPEVPTLPPPPHPVQYADNSYSVYGLRKRIRNTMDTDVEVTGYIVEVYAPPECPEGETCRAPAAPHMWIADTPNERDRHKRIAVVGYAENQAQIDEAVTKARNGTYRPPPAESGILPIPTDFGVGNKVKIRGHFARVSGSGFNISDGLLDYRGHDTLEAAAAAEAAEDS